uniref:Uncharacterized protein n=1 Tax=Cacopsylla melanoneura TaxID=428564 RepID=A0A8D8WRU4_9HEMI
MMESIPQCKRFRGIDSLEYSILPSFYLAVKEDIFLACFQTSYLSKLTRFLPRASTPPVFIVESSAPPISLLWSNMVEPARPWPVPMRSNTDTCAICAPRSVRTSFVICAFTLERISM